MRPNRRVHMPRGVWRAVLVHRVWMRPAVEKLGNSHSAAGRDAMNERRTGHALALTRLPAAFRHVQRTPHA